jgi:preprotein translocase subunit SecD
VRRAPSNNELGSNDFGAYCKVCINRYKTILLATEVEAIMESKSSQLQQNKTNPSPKIILVTAGIFIVVCVLIALGVFYKFGLPYFGPKSQIFLGPDYSLVSTLDSGDLDMDAQILNARARALGTGITFSVSSNNQIVAQGPSSALSHDLVGKTVAIGLLEIVDFGETPVPPGTTIATDFDYKYFPAMEETKWHTVLTNSAFESAYVKHDNSGKYQIPFTLTADGAKILSDFTANNIGHYLGIVLDKVVLSAPKVNSPITGGSGVIAGSFTQEEAESLATYLQVKGPLPIPLVVKEISENGNP